MSGQERVTSEVEEKLGAVYYYIHTLNMHFIWAGSYIGPLGETMYPNSVVDEIARILGKDFAEKNLQVLKISSYSNNPFIPFIFRKKRNVKVYSHAAALYKGMVLDPLVGSPVTLDQYVDIAFENPSRLFRKQIVPYERRSSFAS